MHHRQHRRRQRAAARSTGPLAAYYAAPVPDDRTPAAELRLLAVDVETTGLDPATDRVLSVGFVPVDGDAIVLAGARQVIVRPEEPEEPDDPDDPDAGVGQSAVFHGLTDDVVAAGAPLAEAVEATLEACAGRVLLAHWATLEVGLLSRACERHFGAPFVPPVVDTLLLARRLSRRSPDETRSGELRLWSARERYGLPRYAAHAALTDALACAELYLAQVAELDADRRVTLKRLRS
ncbi:DNA polymerase III subunit epsilon [Nocardioides sp. GY 10113]|nr:DNA polymerase III subunit epsilon [Nocardioides sp. GY 10113]